LTLHDRAVLCARQEAQFAAAAIRFVQDRAARLSVDGRARDSPMRRPTCAITLDLDADAGSPETCARFFTQTLGGS
jgi:hypothetical protein